MKRSLFFAAFTTLAVILISAAVFSYGEGGSLLRTIPEEMIAGDADGDGELSDWDAITLERYLAGWNVEIHLELLDLDADEDVSDWDAIMLSRYLAGWNVEFAPLATAEQTAEPTPEPTPCRHSYGEWETSVAPTCTKAGEEKAVCVHCGNEITQTVPATGHNYVLIRQQTASYAHDGYKLERCTNCSNAKINNIVMRTSLAGFYDGKRPIVFEGSGFKGLHDWYFYTGNDSLSYFQGENVLSAAEYKQWMDTYTALHNECEKRGITVAFLIAPNKEQVYGEYMPSGVTIVDDSQKRQPKFVEYLKQQQSPIHYVYPLSQLKTAKIIYETYLQQDTHWNSVGAFVAAMQVYSSVGMKTTGIQNVDVTLGTRSGGDLVTLGVGPKTEYTNYSVNYKPEITVNTTYYSNYVTDQNEKPNSELRVFTSNAQTEKKAVIIGDSFRNAMGTYFAKDFCEVTLAHREELETVSKYKKQDNGPVENTSKTVLKDAVNNLKSGDLLVLMAVERYDQRNVDFAGTLAEYIAALPLS
ncbi:MAG: hypothetical protein K6G89_10150 [Clostridia bacterium]|nr:hypothetical protein [Clostridia bacterium]